MDIFPAFTADCNKRAGRPQWSWSLKSDFAAARVHLDRAYHYLQGDDEISRHACAGLDILIEAVMTAEHSKGPGKVVPFPARRGGNKSKATNR